MKFNIFFILDQEEWNKITNEEFTEKKLQVSWNFDTFI